MRVPKIYYAFRGHGFSLLGRKTLPVGSFDAQDVLAQTLPQDVAYLVCVPFLLFPLESPLSFLSTCFAFLNHVITLYMTFKTQPNHAKHERMAYSDHCSLMRACVPV